MYIKEEFLFCLHKIKKVCSYFVDKGKVEFKNQNCSVWDQDCPVFVSMTDGDVAGLNLPHTA